MKKNYQKLLLFKKELIFLFCFIGILFLSIGASSFLKIFNNSKKTITNSTEQRLWTLSNQIENKENLRREKITEWSDALLDVNNIIKKDLTVPTKHQNYWKKLNISDQVFFVRVWIKQILFINKFTRDGEKSLKEISLNWSKKDKEKIWKIAEDNDYDGFLNFLFEKTKSLLERYEYLIDYFISDKNILKNPNFQKGKDKKIVLNGMEYDLTWLAKIKNWKEIKANKSLIFDWNRNQENDFLAISSLVFVKKYKSFFEFDIQTYKNKKTENDFDTLDQIMVGIYSMYLIIFLFLLINSHYKNRKKN